MSGGSPRDRALLPEDAAGRQAVAGEYVLGTLDARMAARVALAMQSDPLWRQEVETWQGLLAPLVALTEPESPPPDTWDRIETRIAPPQPRRRGLRPGRFTWPWQAWAIGATLAAAAIAGMVYVPRGGAPGMMTVLVTDRNAPALTAEVQSNGALRLASYPAAMGQRLAAPSGRQLELWGLAPGA
ncbi:MAG: hypothetical protein KGQ40_08180, partial [Rhodospirillales bacterium]|nr:hypothetical protein [Rhodospirillales bacterium]